MGVALALAAWAGSSAPACARVPTDFVGMTSDDVFVGSPEYRELNLESQFDMGVRILRQTFDWSWIENHPGRFDLGYYDDFVAAAAEADMRILPILFHTPDRYAVKPRRLGPAPPPRSTAPFARFAAALVQRYGPQGSLWRERPELPKRPIRSWQIWNEPNLRGYWNPRPSARAYVRLLKAAGVAIKRIDPRAEIVAAGLPPSGLRPAVPLTRYVRHLYAAGAKRYFDTFAYHVYGADPAVLARGVRDVRRLLDRLGDRRKPIWITELGWSTAGGRHPFNVGARGQARRIASSFRLLGALRRRARLRGFVYYCWRDRRPFPPVFRKGWGLHTGLNTLSGVHKPGFFAFRRAIGELRR